jgi:hypothetical protein
MLGACLFAVVGIVTARLAIAAVNVEPDAPRAELWRRLADQIPARWRSRRTVAVREVTGSSLEGLVRLLSASDDKGIQDPSSVDGCYQTAHDGQPATITLRRDMPRAEASLVFTHEYGHFIWENGLSDGERAHYRRIWWAQRAAGHLVTEYAASEDEEGFAEAFAHFLRNPAKLKRRDVRSWRFLHDCSAEPAPPSFGDEPDPEPTPAEQ